MQGLVDNISDTSQRIQRTGARVERVSRHLSTLAGAVNEAEAGQDLADSHEAAGVGTKKRAQALYVGTAALLSASTRAPWLQAVIDSTEQPPPLERFDYYWHLSGQQPGQARPRVQVGPTGHMRTSSIATMSDTGKSASCLFSDPGACLAALSCRHPASTELHAFPQTSSWTSLSDMNQSAWTS